MLNKRNDWLDWSRERRTSIKASFSGSEKKHLYRGMLLTRAVDNALKHLFLSGAITYKNVPFQGKGFRSLGQEAIYGAALRLKRGSNYVDNGSYTGDFVAPLIRDLGVFLAMSGDDVVTAINAQAGKAGPPCDGRDFHLGAFSQGILTPAAPLAIATCTLLGIALSFKRRQEKRIAISFIGDGGCSLGEWHEAINFAAVLDLPMIFCIENNQWALSTPLNQQSRAQCFADKGKGYGINALTIDGNDIEEIASAFDFAESEINEGFGPLLIELITMRMCGHAHHDDSLYLGSDPRLGFHIEPINGRGYVDEKLYEEWRARDPIILYEEKLIKEGSLSKASIKDLKEEVTTLVNVGIGEVKLRPWPKLAKDTSKLVWKAPHSFKKKEPTLSKNTFSKDGVTYMQAIGEAVRRSLEKYKECVIIGEDVAQPYGNAFMMFKAIMHKHQDRFINTPISENAIIGASVGMALSGMRPIAEIQFNDFVACAMDQIVNNAAATYFRLNQNLPMVVRMPYGGLRRAGPFHSQDTSPWFYRTPGLKIVAPSTPHDAFHLLIQAIDDPDPVLFYEHIALYRDPKIKQELLAHDDIHGAGFLALGDRLSIISYGAYVHVATRISDYLLKRHAISADVIDLRYLMPLDFESIYKSVKKTSRVLLIAEDKKTGGILESLASKIGEELFSYLDAPVVVLGSKDTPVPYAPSLEDEYLLNEKQIIDAALNLISF